MKRYSVLLGIIVAAVACSTLPAQEKPAVLPNATVLSILQASAGKAVELHLRSGEKIGGRVGQVTDNIVYLSPLNWRRIFRRLRRCERCFGSGNPRGWPVGS